MEKITKQTLMEKKGQLILIGVLLIACIWVFWPSGGEEPPKADPQANQQPEPQQPAQPGAKGKTGTAAAPPPPPTRTVTSGSS